MEVKLTLLVRMDVLKITGASLGTTGALTRLEPAETILMNPGLCVLGGIHGNTDDTGEVEAKWETSGVSGSEGYVRMDRLGITGVSL